LLAAATLEPDSADAYIGLMRERYPTSVYTLALDGRDTPLLGRISRGDQLLQAAWTAGSKAMSDTLNALRRAAEARQNPTVATTTAAPNGVPPR
jgi:hypothetical protein